MATTTPGPTTGNFKPPKPRIYSGDNNDRDASTLEAWIETLKDYITLSNITDDTLKLRVMQYFLSGTAEDFYHTKRREPDITFDLMLAKLKEYLIPSTAINKYWKDWHRIYQTKNGLTRPINEVAIQIEKLAYRIGSAINEQIKIQKFLDSMHPELQLAVESDIEDRGTATWENVKKLAERKDAGLFQARKYGRTQDGSKQQYSSNANITQRKNNLPNQRNTSNSNTPGFNAPPRRPNYNRWANDNKDGRLGGGYKKLTVRKIGFSLFSHVIFHYFPHIISSISVCIFSLQLFRSCGQVMWTTSFWARQTRSQDRFMTS
jgi:hypothetical protein